MTDKESIQVRAAKKLRQFNNHTPHTDTRKVLDTVIELIDERLAEIDKYILLSDSGHGYRNALVDLKKELEK